jgi:uncharacterized membrane protein YdjX (TVP38/TMEM64 family)
MINFIKKYGAVAIILTLMVGFWVGGFGEYLTRDNFLAHKDAFQSYIVENYILSILIFICVYACIVALSLPFATLMTLAGGFLFGFVGGTIAVVTAATLGATIIFFIAKSSFGETLRARAGNIYNRIERDMNNNAVGYLLFIRLVPLFPFFVVNIVPALFNVKTRTYILTTFFGILPGTAVFVNVGRSLDQIENPADLVSPDIILAIALLGLFALIPTLYQKLKRKK